MSDLYFFCMQHTPKTIRPSLLPSVRTSVRSAAGAGDASGSAAASVSRRSDAALAASLLHPSPPAAHALLRSGRCAMEAWGSEAPLDTKVARWFLAFS